jgi:hypothetical protein
LTWWWEQRLLPGLRSAARGWSFVLLGALGVFCADRLSPENARSSGYPVVRVTTIERTVTLAGKASAGRPIATPAHIATQTVTRPVTVTETLPAQTVVTTVTVTQQGHP